MRRFIQRWGNMISAFILFVAKRAAGRCAFDYHQPMVPDKLKKMRNNRDV